MKLKAWVGKGSVGLPAAGLGRTGVAFYDGWKHLGAVTIYIYNCGENRRCDDLEGTSRRP